MRHNKRTKPSRAVNPGRKEKSMKPFKKYDIEKLVEARNIIEKVFEFYFCVPGYSKKEKRLETILRKLNELLDIDQ